MIWLAGNPLAPSSTILADIRLLCGHIHEVEVWSWVEWSVLFWHLWWSFRSTTVLQPDPCRLYQHTVDVHLEVCLLGDISVTFCFACMPQAVLLAACV